MFALNHDNTIAIYDGIWGIPVWRYLVIYRSLFQILYSLVLLNLILLANVWTKKWLTWSWQNKMNSHLKQECMLCHEINCQDSFPFYRNKAFCQLIVTHIDSYHSYFDCLFLILPLCSLQEVKIHKKKTRKSL